MHFRPEELKTPKKAISRFGEEHAIELYLSEVEPAHRDDLEPHPKDWAWRKYLLFKHMDGRCEQCQKIGHFAEMTAHHKIAGNGHGLENLELLHEWPCHRRERHSVQKAA